jgi:Loader and inhibitor of phage G40P.
MTLIETGMIMSILQAAYPQFYKNQTDEERAAALNLWASIFVDDNSSIVTAAVKALIETDEKGFPPHIGAVKARIRQLTEPPQMTELEAWALVSRAASRGTYDATEEFDRLPRMIQKALGSPNTLREWAQVESDIFQTVIQSNFMRSFRTMAARERDYNALPEDVKKLVSGMTQKLLEE